MNAAAFRATYVGVRPVNGRKVVQFVFETPIEEGDAAMSTLGGLPRPDQSVWVGIARIDPKAASEPAKAQEPPKERRRFNTLPLPQQVAMTCQEEGFVRFLIAEKCSASDTRTPEEFVRDYCAVRSRAEILPGSEPAKAWRELFDHYRAWLQVDA